MQIFFFIISFFNLIGENKKYNWRNSNYKTKSALLLVKNLFLLILEVKEFSPKCAEIRVKRISVKTFTLLWKKPEMKYY